MPDPTSCARHGRVSSPARLPERDRWPAPPADSSRLVSKAHVLRGRPIGGLTVEDLRLLIGQGEGLAHLLPLALEVLRDDPMAQGDMYEGVLLSAVLTS
ncbi:contact-dependent growth inhibition system immunity protein [Streptomyces sp. NPDC002599]|uniref:contact-dependent growth inhibition system immunity protein n=1 Tax=Streptomyces sp. NPDC002599 TaxID=3154421 RepID=UPI0033340C98